MSVLQDVYFTTSLKRSGTKIRKIGGGKLFRKYYNVRSKMKQTGLLASTSKSHLKEQEGNTAKLSASRQVTFMLMCVLN